MTSLPPAPLPNSYWVLPGRLLGGEYPATGQLDGTRERIERLLGAGIDCFLDLTPPGELPPYEDVLPAGITHHRVPIRDHDVPEHPQVMAEIVALIGNALSSGRSLYVHCRAGVGRTGTVMGCFLVERGLDAEAALEELNHAWQQSARAALWPRIPETEAQVEYVHNWAARARAGVRSIHPVRERFLGALVGLAVGDALAAPTQQWEPGSFEPVTGLMGGGVYDLPAGAWTDDTAMALLLGESLLARRGFDARDQIDRYLRWRQEGYPTATGRCIGLRAGVAKALAAAQWRRQLFPGSHAPRQLDPEPLSRIAPAVLFAFPALEEAVQLAGDAARITCQAPIAVDACRALAAMLHVALEGGSKSEVLFPSVPALFEGATVRPPMRSLRSGHYRRKQPGKMRSGTTTVQLLEAALWAFERTSTFAEGALLAVNLGGNSDIVGAVYGQLAGAHYGVGGIPAAWRSELSHPDLIEGLANELFEVSRNR